MVRRSCFEEGEPPHESSETGNPGLRLKIAATFAASALLSDARTEPGLIRCLEEADLQRPVPINIKMQESTLDSLLEMRKHVDYQAKGILSRTRRNKQLSAAPITPLLHLVPLWR